MNEAVIFATGSAILVDIEESLRRAGITLKAGVQNHDGACHLTNPRLRVALSQLDANLLELPFIVPLFNPANRLRAVAEARANGFQDALTLIDPSAIIPRELDLGQGSYVGAGATLGAASSFGAFTFLNRGASVGHHFSGGEYVSIGPGAVVAGQVSIGDNCLIGAGAVVLPERKVGANSIIGAGAVVTQNVAENCTVVGNPAKVIRGRS